MITCRQLNDCVEEALDTIKSGEDNGMSVYQACEFVTNGLCLSRDDVDEIFGLVYDALHDDGISANVYDFDR